MEFYHGFEQRSWSSGNYKWGYFVSYIVEIIIEDEEFEKFIRQFIYPKNYFGIINYLEFKFLLKNYVFDGINNFHYSRIDKTNTDLLVKEIIDSIDKSIMELMGDIPDFLRKCSVAENVIELYKNKLIEYYNNPFSFHNTNLHNQIKNWRHIVARSDYFHTDALEMEGYTMKPLDRQPFFIHNTLQTVNYFDPAIYQILQKNPELLRTMDWRLFEEMLADILKRFGYDVELTRKTKDGGIDIIAIKYDNHFGSNKYILQAKRYSNKIQVSPVRELLFLQNDIKATKGILATTATFTRGAWELAEQHKWHLELKDKGGILDWINAISSKK